MIFISTQLLAPEASVTGRYSDMGNDQFVTELQGTWAALGDVRKVIEAHVKQGNIKPIDGIRGFSAFTANVLGYEEFVPRSAIPSLSTFSSQ